MIPAWDISLPRFEGPLDLLLELVRRNQIEITDIPIAEITRQYFDYVRRAEALDMDLGSEFAHIAALLIYIKSRSLLASDPAITLSREDPREELVRLLLEHDQVRHAAEFLQQKLEIAGATWSTSSIHDFQQPAMEEPAAPAQTLNLVEVLRMARQALEAARVYDIVTPPDSVTVEQMVEWLERRLPFTPENVEVQPLLAEQPSFQRKAALFLAILEMTKAGLVKVDQEECFGPLWLCGTTVP